MLFTLPESPFCEESARERERPGDLRPRRFGGRRRSGLEAGDAVFGHNGGGNICVFQC